MVDFCSGFYVMDFLFWIFSVVSCLCWIFCSSIFRGVLYVLWCIFLFTRNSDLNLTHVCYFPIVCGPGDDGPEVEWSVRELRGAGHHRQRGRGGTIQC